MTGATFGIREPLTERLGGLIASDANRTKVASASRVTRNEQVYCFDKEG